MNTARTQAPKELYSRAGGIDPIAGSSGSGQVDPTWA
jgi:hypothetical protein